MAKFPSEYFSFDDDDYKHSSLPMYIEVEAKTTNEPAVLIVLFQIAAYRPSLLYVARRPNCFHNYVL